MSEEWRVDASGDVLGGVTGEVLLITTLINPRSKAAAVTAVRDHNALSGIRNPEALLRAVRDYGEAAFAVDVSRRKDLTNSVIFYEGEALLALSRVRAELERGDG